MGPFRCRRSGRLAQALLLSCLGLRVVDAGEQQPPCSQPSDSPLETPCFRRLANRTGFELRQYGVGGSRWQDVFSSVQVANPVWHYARDVGFAQNEAFIHGDNSANLTIPATAPRVTRVLDYVNWRIMYYMPASRFPSVASLPVSRSDPGMNNVPIPANATFAVLAFSTGNRSADDGDFRVMTAALNTSIQRDGGLEIVEDSWWQVWTGFARSNGTAAPMAHNEVWLHVRARVGE
jgi:hypothetical protein